MALEIQLEIYILDMRDSEVFFEPKGIGELAKKNGRKKKNLYSLVFFACDIIFDFATTTIKKSFSAMNIVKINN